MSEVIPDGAVDALESKGTPLKTKSPVVVRYLIRNRGPRTLDLLPDSETDSMVTVAERENCSVSLVAEPRYRTVPPGAVVYFDLNVTPVAKGTLGGGIAVRWRSANREGSEVKTQAIGFAATAK